MKINGEEIKFSILPMFDKVQATIFRLHKLKEDDYLQLRLIDKEFGNMFRKPNEQDYIDARKWIDMQMESIKKANSQQPSN